MNKRKSNGIKKVAMVGAFITVLLTLATPFLDGNFYGPMIREKRFVICKQMRPNFHTHMELKLGLVIDKM